MAEWQSHYAGVTAAQALNRVEIGVLERPCLGRRIGTDIDVNREVAAWTKERDDRRVKMKWQFTKEKAKKVFKIDESNMQN